MKYKINDIYRSIQGEGARTGTINVFIRFSGCNLKCEMNRVPFRSPGGFDCDTDFESGELLELDEIHDRVMAVAGRCRSIILTGGEPALQADDNFVDRFKPEFLVAIETNGTKKVSPLIDWVTVSPKLPEHLLEQLAADEVKYVVSAGDRDPETSIRAKHKYISPAFDGDSLVVANVIKCLSVIARNPEWSLTVQLHKFLDLK